MLSNMMAIFTCLPMAIGILAFGKAFSKLLENKMLLVVGEISYEIYLVHAFTLNLVRQSIAAVLSFVVITGTLAYMTHFIIGKIKNGKFNNYYSHEK